MNVEGSGPNIGAAARTGNPAGRLKGAPLLGHAETHSKREGLCLWSLRLEAEEFLGAYYQAKREDGDDDFADGAYGEGT